MSIPLILKMIDSPHRPPAFAAGPHDSYAAMEGECAPSYLEARLSPLGAYTLLRVPLHEMRGQVVDLVDLFGGAGTRLAERIREASRWERRFEILDEFLLRRVAEGPRPAPEVVWVWRRIEATAGAVAINRLAEEVGWSHRHLIAMFKRHIGVSPRTSARVVRFERVLRQVDPHAPPCWGSIATDLGYADQAHLIRDFKLFTGSTPTEFVEASGNADA